MRPPRTGEGPVAAILLAAGEATRMGSPKQLLPWAGTTLIEWQIGRLQEAGVEAVVVVLGGHAAEVEPRAQVAGAKIVLNERFREGRASSLRAGAEAVGVEAGRVVVLNVDQPRPAWVTAVLLDKSSSTDALVVVPVHAGRGGHPVVMRGDLLQELRMVDEKSLGLRAVLERHVRETERVQFANSCVIVDLNTPAEYEAALSAYNRGEWDRDTDSPITDE